MLPIVDDWRLGGRVTLTRWVKVVEEGRLVGGTRTLIGGFDTVAVGLSAETVGLEARDGRRTGPVGFCVTLEAAVVGLVSGTSDLGSGGD